MDWFQIIRFIIHYGLHFIVPGIIAFVFFRNNWKKAWLIMIATVLVDLDHLLAYPDIFVAERCSINFHPLHTYYAMIVYLVMAYFPKLRILAVGLLFHMITDSIDCFWI